VAPRAVVMRPPAGARGFEVVAAGTGALAGEGEEDVVEARPAHLGGGYRHAVAVEQAQRGGQQGGTVRDTHLEAAALVGVGRGLGGGDGAEVGERAGRSGQVGRVCQADAYGVAAEAGSEVVGCPGRDQAPAVDDRDGVGQAVGFLEVLGGEQDRRATGDELVDERPEPVAAGGVEAGGGVVSTRTSVVLPAPLGPSKASTDPAGTSIETPSRAVRWP